MEEQLKDLNIFVHDVIIIRDDIPDQVIYSETSKIFPIPKLPIFSIKEITGFVLRDNSPPVIAIFSSILLNLSLGVSL